MAAGAAAQVQDRQPVDGPARLMDERFLQRRQGIGIVVVDQGPAVIALADRWGLGGLHEDLPGAEVSPRAVFPSSTADMITGAAVHQALVFRGSLPAS